MSAYGTAAVGAKRPFAQWRIMKTCLESRAWNSCCGSKLPCVLLRSTAAELRATLGDEGGYSLLRVIHAAGGDDRFFFGI
jgi:hypothetical protein